MQWRRFRCWFLAGEFVVLRADVGVDLLLAVRGEVGVVAVGRLRGLHDPPRAAYMVFEGFTSSFSASGVASHFDGARTASAQGR